MGAVVLRVVHRLNGLLGKAYAHALHLKEHVGLILETLPLYFAEAFQVLSGYCPEPCLCVGELYAVADAEKRYLDALVFGSEPPKKKPLIYKVVKGE